MTELKYMENNIKRARYERAYEKNQQANSHKNQFKVIMERMSL